MQPPSLSPSIIPHAPPGEKKPWLHSRLLIFDNGSGYCAFIFLSITWFSCILPCSLDEKTGLTNVGTICPEDSAVIVLQCLDLQKSRAKQKKKTPATPSGQSNYQEEAGLQFNIHLMQVGGLTKAILPREASRGFLVSTPFLVPDKSSRVTEEAEVITNNVGFRGGGNKNVLV